MKTYERGPHGNRLASKIKDSLEKDGYYVWDVFVNVNEFPPYTKHIGIKMDEDTNFEVHAATDYLKVFTDMIKKEIDVLRLLGFEDSPKPFNWNIGYDTAITSRSHSKIVIVDYYKQLATAMLEPKGLSDSPE